jgi:hypothetical protein
LQIVDCKLQIEINLPFNLQSTLYNLQSYLASLEHRTDGAMRVSFGAGRRAVMIQVEERSPIGIRLRR